MKVLQIGKFYPPFKGGMETVLKDLSQGLSKEGHNVRVICSSENNSYSHSHEQTLEVYKYPTKMILASQPLCPSLWINLRQHLKWADVIHIHSPNPIIELLIIILSWNKKIVCTHHSDIHRQKLLKVFYSPLWNIFKKKVNRFLIPTKNHIIYSDMINDIELKSSIIPFGLAENFANDINRVQKPFDNYFLFVGRLVGYKGLSYLIKAIGQTNENLIIIGRGPLKEELINQINKENLSKRIKIISDVESSADLNSYYAQAKCFILPSISKNENFGMVQLEAMAHKLPLIITNIKSGVPTVSIPGKTSYLVEPRNTKELTEAIKKIVEKPDYSIRMGLEGYKLFHEKYTYESMINGHIKSYQEVLSE